jgi:hypothetical protein
MHITLNDILNTPSYINQITQALHREETLTGKQEVFLSELDSNAENDSGFNAFLEVKQSDGSFKPIATQVFQREQLSEIDIDFPVDSEILNNLDRKKVTSLRLRVQTDYPVRTEHQDYEITADFLDAQFTSAWHDIISNAGNENTFFIKTGGSGSEKSEFFNQLLQNISISVVSYQATDPNSRVSHQPQEEIQKHSLTMF